MVLPVLGLIGHALAPGIRLSMVLPVLGLILQGLTLDAGDAAHDFCILVLLSLPVDGGNDRRPEAFQALKIAQR